MSYTNQRYISSCLDVLNHEILNYTEATGGLDMNLKCHGIIYIITILTVIMYMQVFITIAGLIM